MIAAGRWHRYFENVPLLQSMLVPLILWCTTFYAGNFESEQLTRTFFVSYFLSATLCVETFNLDVKVGTSSTTLHVRTLLDTTFLILSCGRCSSGRWLILVRTFCKRAFCIRTYLTAPKHQIHLNRSANVGKKTNFRSILFEKKVSNLFRKKIRSHEDLQFHFFGKKCFFLRFLKKNSGASDDFRIPVETKKITEPGKKKKWKLFFSVVTVKVSIWRNFSNWAILQSMKHSWMEKDVFVALAYGLIGVWFAVLFSCFSRFDWLSLSSSSQ